MSNVRSVGNGKVIIQPSDDPESFGTSSKPKRNGSLALFFRKVYHLSHLRLDALCQALQIVDEDVKRKIWTTFEHTLTKETDLMKDRHLDQLLMCSLYIVCKVAALQKNFTDIMKQYRNQPQAASHVYRSVLLRPKNSSESPEPSKENAEKEETKTTQTPPTPTKLAGASTILDGEERGDLIKFYNQVFMVRLQEFSLKFKRSRQTEAPPLSPLPKLRAHPQSPCRRVSENHPVYIRPLKATPNDMVTYNPHSPHKPLSYSFSRSPAKDLAAINALMRTEVERKSRVGKRLLADESESTVQTFVIQQPANATEEPPVKMQIISQGSGALNAKLGMVLGDRTLSD